MRAAESASHWFVFLAGRHRDRSYRARRGLPARPRSEPLNIILWALATGFISGGAWVAIVLMRRQHRLFDDQAELQEHVHRRLDTLTDVEARLAEVEERLEFAERVLAEGRDPARLHPPLQNE